MTDKTLRTLAAGVTPQDTDLFLTRQAADITDKSVTFSQIKSAATANLFNVTTDTLDDITAGTVNKQFTADEKTKLGSVGTGANVISVNGDTGVVVLDKADIGLSNADNTSDANKPISTATQAALNAKYDVTNPSNYVDAAGAQTATFAPVTVTSSRALTQSDNRKIISNVGAGAEVNLTAPTGLQSPSFAASVANLDSDGIRFTVPGGCFIYFGDQLSSDGGSISTTAVGSVLNICQISATIWVVTGATGNWQVN